MDRKNDGERMNDEALSFGDEINNVSEENVELFELAAESDEIPYTPAPEDIFVISDPEDDAENYPEAFSEYEEGSLLESEEDDEVFSEIGYEGDDEEYSEDDEDEEYFEDDEDEEYSEDDEDEEYSEDDEDEEYSEDDEDEEYSEDDEDEDYSEDDEDEEYSEDDEDEDYSEDDEDEDYSEDDEDEEYSEDDEDEEYSEDDDDEEYSEDDEDEEYSEDDDDEEYSEDDEDEEYSEDDEDEEYSEDDEDEEYSEDDEDEEYSEDDEDEEYSEDDEDEDYSEDDEDEDYSEDENNKKVYNFEKLPYGYTDYPDDVDEEDASKSDTGYDDEYYEEEKEEETQYENSESEAEEDVCLSIPDGVIGEADWLKDEDGNPLANNRFAEMDSDENYMEDEPVDLFAVAANADDLPEAENHGVLYYWAKRKTVGGWVKFGLKCVAAILLIIIVSGVLYFNGLLNLIDYKAADDFEIYDSISESDYDDDEGMVYSNPESYIETTTIEGFDESMIDIPKKDVLNILLIGTDVRGGTYDERGNTDSMILISVNTRDKTIKLTSFMRDMYVYIPNRQWARLNVAYAYGGPQLLFDTLKQNFDVDVDLYVRVNFANFRKIVNHVGGVDIELSEAEAKYMNDNSEKYKTKPVEAGMQHLDGAQALSYARCRKIDSDFNRTKRQRTVILALVEKIKHSSPGELNSLLNVFLPMIQTNMSKMQILGLMVDGTSYLNNEIETLNVPIKNSWRSETINKRSVLCPNFELNKTAIVAHIYSTYHLDVDKTKYQRFSIPNQ